MADSCSKCSAEIDLNQRSCPVCNTDAGFPNVRTARRHQEVEALAARYRSARDSVSARGVLSEFEEFEQTASASAAVMNRTLGALAEWMNGQSPLFLSFHYQVQQLGRSPSASDWDQQREAAEAAINPFYYRELNFAALSLDGLGMTYYGPYTVGLRSLTIEDRASVFEQNPFIFNRTHHVVAGQAPPVGYRAPWNSRGRLAATKLHAKIAKGDGPAEFALTLMERRRGESDCDFVEVHIYGPVNRLGIEQITGPLPQRRADRLLWEQIVRKAVRLGARTEAVA